MNYLLIFTIIVFSFSIGARVQEVLHNGINDNPPKEPQQDLPRNETCKVIAIPDKGEE